MIYRKLQKHEKWKTLGHLTDFLLERINNSSISTNSWMQIKFFKSFNQLAVCLVGQTEGLYILGLSV